MLQRSSVSACIGFALFPQSQLAVSDKNAPCVRIHCPCSLSLLLPCLLFTVLAVHNTAWPSKDGPKTNLLPSCTFSQICVRSPLTFQGYYKNPEESAKTVLEGGWVLTGDIGMWTKVRHRYGPRALQFQVNTWRHLVVAVAFPQKKISIYSSALRGSIRTTGKLVHNASPCFIPFTVVINVSLTGCAGIDARIV